MSQFFTCSGLTVKEIMHQIDMLAADNPFVDEHANRENIEMDKPYLKDRILFVVASELERKEAMELIDCCY